MDRLQWNLTTLVDPYLEHGHRDPAWDKAATNALAIFAAIRSNNSTMDESDRSLLSGYCQEAVLNGCADPMLLYLHTRMVLGYREGMTDEIMGEAYKKAASSALQHPCAPIRQFYLALRTSESINYATGGKATSPQVHQFRRTAISSLLTALQDPNIPPIEVHEACRELMAAMNRSPMKSEVYRNLEPILLKNWPDEAFVYNLQGRYHIDEAWLARGTGYSDSVKQEGWKLFGEHLNKAADALEKAWKLNPTDANTALEMINVELGEGKGRKRMELWFDRAMALNTNYTEACRAKLFYLEPKWHGSAEDMLAFARECAASEKWGGEVLLMPLYAHDSLAGYAKREGNTNYWKNPRIWTEIQSTLDKFFSLHPEAVSWRHNYAWYAYHCEQWSEFNKQLTYFSQTNYAYFGGQETFERMIKNAKKSAATAARN